MGWPKVLYFGEMIYSGADLIRTSGQQVERFGKLGPLSPVNPVSETEKPSGEQSALDQNTQSALLRLARFVHDKNKKEGKRPPIFLVKNGRKSSLPQAYLNQIELTDPNARRTGESLDITV